jgi:class 3 adenylate cyclase/tetratricopeptide (TPR) repeat protein
VTEATRFDPGSPEAPRRLTATMLFSDLSESTQIAGGLQDEDYGDLLWRIQTIFHRIVGRHEGQIAQISADGMFAAFGHPEPREDDVRRAVEAALDLHDAVRALGSEERWRRIAPKLHSGIHTGRVLFVSGDEVRGRFELLGRHTNLASRLCKKAGPDQILVSERTLGPERYLFETSAPYPLQLRGRDHPLSTLTVTGRAPISSRYAASERAGLTPFVGREAELRQLLRGLEQVTSGKSLSLDIRGPAGEGKTRLAEEFLRHAVDRGCPVHRGECEATGEPLQPFIRIARSIFGIGPLLSADEAVDRVDEGLAAIDEALSAHRTVWLRLLSLDSEKAAPETAGPALRALFAGLSRRAPAVLFIDDWHDADDASRAMLDELRGIGALFILTTSRPKREGDVQMGERPLLRLPPFTEQETAQVVSQLLRVADPFLVQDITDSSGGNPLFIEELCHSVASGQREERPHEGSGWLNILIQSRFSRLPQAQADLVRAAAVIGTIVPAWLLELVTGYTEDDPLLADLADEDFIFRGEREGTLRFKHGITRDVIYDSVGLRERRLLHLQIAETLHSSAADHGEDSPYDALAYHYGAGGDDEATAHYAELAGDRAAAVSALDRAQAQYRAALTALEQLPESDENVARWGRIAQSFGRSGVFDPSRDQLAVFERAVEMAVRRCDRAALVRAEFWLGYINYALGEPVAAIQHYERALEAALEIGDLRLLVQIRAALGQTRQAACDYAAALPLLDEAIEAMRRPSAGAAPRIGAAYSLACKGFALGDMGRFAEAHALYEEAMATIGGRRRELEASVLDQRSAVCLWQGRMEEALGFAQEAERIAERIRSKYDFAMSRALAGYARWKLEPTAAAVQALVQATGWLEEGQRNQNISLNYGWLAEIMVENGRFAEARHYAACALRRARKRDPMGEAMALRAMARAAARNGGPRPPAHYLERAMASARARAAPHEIAVTLLCEAELALAAGDPALAEPPLAAARAAFADMDMAHFTQRAEAMASTSR